MKTNYSNEVISQGFLIINNLNDFNYEKDLQSQGLLQRN